MEELSFVGNESMSKKKGAQPANNNGTKLKDPDIRQLAYQKYCEWIGSGESKEAFTFEHEKLTCCFKTIEKYMRDNPLEFPPIHMNVAQAKSFEVWTKRGLDMMLGRVEKCQPAIFQMFMRNKFGWDKESVDEVAQCAADKILERLTK